MCWNCVVEAGGDQIEVTDEMIRVARIIDWFHAHPDCAVGGPLHIITDDTNVDDGSLNFCRQTVEAGRVETGCSPLTGRDVIVYAPEVCAVARVILDGLQPMSRAERARTVNLEARYLR